MRGWLATTGLATLALGCGTTSPTALNPTGALMVQAWGGPAGQVAAQIPLLEPGIGPQASCGAPVIAGACQLTTCQLGGIGSPGFGYGNFGPITAVVGRTSVPVPYVQSGYPTVDFPSAVALGTGGTMTFHGGDGASVPTFDIAVTIPGMGVITAPVPATAGGAAVVDTTQDLTVSWTPIPIGDIHFELSSGGPGDRVGNYLACTFAGTPGSDVVPQALLASLKTGAGTTPTYATLHSELDAMTTVDGLQIIMQGYQTSTAQNLADDFAVTLQ